MHESELVQRLQKLEMKCFEGTFEHGYKKTAKKQEVKENDKSKF